MSSDEAVVPTAPGHSQGAGPQPPRLLDQVRAALQAQNQPPGVIEPYMGWVSRFVHCHRLRHPREMAASEVNRFLSHLAAELREPLGRVAQARHALVFLYEQVLRQPFGPLQGGR